MTPVGSRRCGMVQACSRQEHQRPKSAGAGRGSRAYHPLHRCRRASHPRTSVSARSQSRSRLETLIATLVREFVGDDALLEAIMNPLLAGREALMREYARLHRLVLKAARNDPACRLLMTMPGIGPFSALTFPSTVDDPRQFLHSQSVGAYLGLTPRRYQSGELIGWDGSQKSEMERRAQPCSKLPTLFSGHQPDGLR